MIMSPCPFERQSLQWWEDPEYPEYPKKSEFCRFQTLNLRSWRSWFKISIFCRAVFHHESSSGGKCAQRCAVWNIWLQTWLSQDQVACCRMLSHVVACCRMSLHDIAMCFPNRTVWSVARWPVPTPKKNVGHVNVGPIGVQTSQVWQITLNRTTGSWYSCSWGTTLQQPANGCVKHTRTSWCDKWPWDLHGGIGSHQTGLVNISRRSIRPEFDEFDICRLRAPPRTGRNTGAWSRIKWITPEVMSSSKTNMVLLLENNRPFTFPFNLLNC